MIFEGKLRGGNFSYLACSVRRLFSYIGGKNNDNFILLTYSTDRKTRHNLFEDSADQKRGICGF